jgi:hypothetical protein
VQASVGAHRGGNRSLEPWPWLLPLGFGLPAGIVPAWQAYRADVLERLAPG